MEIKLSELAANTAATATVGGGLLWLFREKVSDWVRSSTKVITDVHMMQIKELERRMQARETHDEVQAQVLGNLSKNVQDGFERLTKAVEKLDDRILDMDRHA